jgi:hypothetical protein
MKYNTLLAIVFFIGCNSSKFYLQEKPMIQVNEAFYEVIPSAIKEGNSFAKITLIFNNSDVLNKIEIKGVYFKNQFAKLISKDKNTFVASIILPKEATLDENKIPFTLNPGEIVVSYKEKNKEKFALFKVKLKDSIDSNTIPR